MRKAGAARVFDIAKRDRFRQTCPPFTNYSGVFMNTFFRGLALTALSTSILASTLALAQDEYFRELNSPRQIAPVVQLNPQEEDKYNLAIGSLRFNVAAGAGIEYNDNIDLSDDNRRSDFIFRPSLNIDSVWPINEFNTLRFSLGLSYAKYFEHSEFDTRGILISPNSEIALTARVGAVDITFRDRFSYQEDPFDIAVLSRVAKYRRFENLAGIQLDWDVNPALHLTAGYNHYNLWTRDDAFESQDRSIDTLFIRPAVKLSPAITVGGNASVSWVNYQHDILNDGRSYMVGPFVDVALTQTTRFYLEAGYQRFDFDDSGIVTDSEDSNSYYVKTEINNRLTDVFNHRLSFSKTTETGFASNFYDLYHLEYAADWRITPSLVLDPLAFYEHYETSDNGEEADRYGTALGLRYVLSPSLTLGADYRFILKDSNLENSDYYQNVVLLSLFYNF